jgi:hypothetical protein
MRYSCGCNTGILITETKQTLKLETIRVHDRHSHIGGRLHVRKSAPGVGWFSRPESEASSDDLQMTNLMRGAPLIFPFHRSDITDERRR